MAEYKMDARHDWLGDAAESYVAYCFAKEGFEVFGAGKWTADLIVRHPKRRTLWRVEVKSTDHPTRGPKHKSFVTLSKKAELLAKVCVRDGKIIFELVRLSPKKQRGKKCEIIHGGYIRESIST